MSERDILGEAIERVLPTTRTPMTQRDLRDLIFELLFERLQTEGPSPHAYCGLLGDAIVVFQPGGKHLGVRVVPAEVAS